LAPEDLKQTTSFLEKHSINPERCPFFGDAANDYEAAVKCGVDFIGIVPASNALLLSHAPVIKWFYNFLEISLPSERRDT
jgi:phosphoglycolate phosphatase-like HAD superfamily hydrolase